MRTTTLELSGQWVPPAPHTINVAACNTHQAIVSYGGNTLVYLEIQGQDLKELGYEPGSWASLVGLLFLYFYPDFSWLLIFFFRRVTMENDIACLDISPLGMVPYITPLSKI